MTGPATEISAELADDLRVLMTPAGYAAVTEAFGAATILRWVARYPDCLPRAAAELLEGLPAETRSSSAGEVLSSFRLDVLEFKFASGAGQAETLADVATRLWQRAATCGKAAASANPVPILEEWGIR